MACGTATCVDAFPNICGLIGANQLCVPQDTDLIITAIGANLDISAPIISGVDAAANGECVAIHLTSSGGLTTNADIGCTFLGIAAGFEDRIYPACTVTCAKTDVAGIAPCTFLAATTSGELTATTADDENAIAVTLETSTSSCTRVMLCKPISTGTSVTPTPYSPEIVFDAGVAVDVDVPSGGGIYNGVLSYAVVETCVHYVSYGIGYQSVGATTSELLIDGVAYNPQGRSGADGADTSVNVKSLMVALSAGQVLSLRFADNSSAGFTSNVQYEQMQVVKMCE